MLQSKVETGPRGCWGWQLGGVQGLREPLSHWGLVEVRWPGFEEYFGGKSQSWGVLAPSGSWAVEEPRMGKRGGEWWEACLQGKSGHCEGTDHMLAALQLSHWLWAS